MKRIIGILLVMAMALGAAAAGTEAKKISAFGYKGMQGEAILIVDGDVARLRGAEKFIPLFIYLGHTEAKALHADRGSFTLTDPAGTKFSMPTTDELLKGYGPTTISADYTLARRLRDYGKMLYLSCTYIRGVAFFPNPSGSPKVLYDKVELPNSTFCSTLLYFPNPTGKAKGNYTLTYDDPKSGTHIDIPFIIEWQK